MRIVIDYEGLTYASDYLARLKNQAFEINDHLQESLGMASAEEKAVIQLLTQICTETFPDMLESSRRLLQAIATDFKAMDDEFGRVSSGGVLAAAAAAVAAAAAEGGASTSESGSAGSAGGNSGGGSR